MDYRFAGELFFIAGILIAIYGIRGAVKRQILFFGKGRLPRLETGSEAFSTGIIYAVLGLSFAILGALFFFMSFDQ